MKSIDYNEVIDKSSLVALASPREIRYSIPRKIKWSKLSPDERKKEKEQFKNKNPNRTFYAPSFKTGKLPAYSWKNSPKSYKGYNDTEYGSAVLCNYIPEYDLYLAVIDLDSPKEPNDISMEKLLEVCQDLMLTTHVKKTPSGGYHIYLLSETKPELKQPSFNLDYQTNTGKLKGKYVVSNYRYAIKIDDEIIDLDKYFKEHNNLDLKKISFCKEEYNHLESSPNSIRVVESSDDILTELLSIIEEKGLYTPPVKKTVKLVKHQQQQDTKKSQNEIVRILSNYVREGMRDELAKAVSGYLYKKGYNLEKCTIIFEKLFNNDEELDHRLDLLERTFDKPKSEVAGINSLRQILSPLDIDKIKKLVEKKQKPLKKEIDHSIDDIDEKIAYYLEYSYPVTDKMIIESIEKTNTLFFEHTTLTYHAKDKDGCINPIDGLFVVNHCNNLFGYNEISKNQCNRALNFVTRPISKEPYTLEFSNGKLVINKDDKTFEFFENEYCTNSIPKVRFPFKWNSKSDGGVIKKSIESILATNKRGFTDNINTFLKCVGHSCMGGIEQDVFPIIVGRPGTGKSTVLTILKRVFTYSEVPVPDIIKNDRFSLTPCVGKDINIDDDLQSEVWKGIGKLNTFVSGNGGSVEIKGENDRLELTTYNTPKLWGGSNALPPVTGDGFLRRLVIIIADNVIPPEEIDVTLQMNILNGLFDSDMEWLIYESITKYMDIRNGGIVKVEDKKAMVEEHKFKSDPLRTAIEFIFCEAEDVNVEVKTVNREIKNWFKYATKKGLVFNEHKRPSQTQFKKAMNRAGYEQVKNGDIRYYEDIVVNKDWISLYNEFKAVEDFENGGL